MARTLPIVIGLALAGLIGAVVGPLMDGTEPPPVTTVARGETDPQILRELEGLRERLDAIEKLAPMRSLPDEVAVAKVATPEEEVEAVLEATDVSEAALAEKVEEVMAEREQKQREEQGRRMSEWVKQRESRVLDNLTENHGLTPHQRGEMEKLLDRRRKAFGEFFGTMFGRGGTRGGSNSDSEQPTDVAAIREKVESIRAETDEEMKTLLSPTQYDAFKEQDRMGMGRGGGPGRGMGGR